MAVDSAPTSDLCRWVCSTRYQDIPPEVRQEAVTLLYDQLGCMIATCTLPSCQPVVDLVRMFGGQGECTIIGHPFRTSLIYAALANGTIGHGDEVDSTGQQGSGHYAASAVPSVLSVGQSLGASGEDAIQALVLGAEVAARVQSIIFKYATRDLFYASVSGALGSAVNAGVLLGLSAEQMEHALGLAASGASGLTSHHLEDQHQTKSLQRGRAAEVGVMSALLASQGVHGPKEILTVENGFFDAFVGVRNVGEQVIDGLGEEYVMRQVAYKRYAVGAPNQAPLYAFLQLIKQHKLSADDIDQIEVSVSRGAFDVVTTNKHPSVDLVSILSIAAVFGDITFNHIHQPSYRQNTGVIAFRDRSRILIVPRPGASTRGERLNTSLTVRTVAGETIHQELRYPLMTDGEIQQKFRDLAGLRLGSNEVLELENQILAVESTTNIAPLVSKLEIPY